MGAHACSHGRVTVAVYLIAGRILVSMLQNGFSAVNPSQSRSDRCWYSRQFAMRSPRSRINDHAVVGVRPGVRVLGGAHLLVGVEHDRVPRHRHRRRVVATEELEQRVPALVVLGVGRLGVPGVVGEAGERGRRVALDPRVARSSRAAGGSPHRPRGHRGGPMRFRRSGEMAARGTDVPAASGVLEHERREPTTPSARPRLPSARARSIAGPWPAGRPGTLDRPPEAVCQFSSSTPPLPRAFWVLRGSPRVRRARDPRRHPGQLLDDREPRLLRDHGVQIRVSWSVAIAK